MSKKQKLNGILLLGLWLGLSVIWGFLGEMLFASATEKPSIGIGQSTAAVVCMLFAGLVAIPGVMIVPWFLSGGRLRKLPEYPYQERHTLRMLLPHSAVLLVIRFVFVTHLVVPTTTAMSVFTRYPKLDDKIDAFLPFFYLLVALMSGLLLWGIYGFLRRRAEYYALICHAGGGIITLLLTYTSYAYAGDLTIGDMTIFVQLSQIPYRLGELMAIAFFVLVRITVRRQTQNADNAPEASAKHKSKLSFIMEPKRMRIWVIVVFTMLCVLTSGLFFTMIDRSAGIELLHFADRALIPFTVLWLLFAVPLILLWFLLGGRLRSLPPPDWKRPALGLLLPHLFVLCMARAVFAAHIKGFNQIFSFSDVSIEHFVYFAIVPMSILFAVTMLPLLLWGLYGLLRRRAEYLALVCHAGGGILTAWFTYRLLPDVTTIALYQQLPADLPHCFIPYLIGEVLALVVVVLMIRRRTAVASRSA